MAQKYKKKTVKELNEEHHQTFMNSLGENNEKEVKEYVCKSCDSKFSNYKTLKVHMKEKHKKGIKCNLCDDKIDETYKLL